MPTKYTPLAIIYDFDGTLSPGNMQEPQFIPDVGMTAQEFWQEVDRLCKAHKADKILMYMRLMLRKAEERNVRVHLNDFRQKGSRVPLFEGVEEWFAGIDSYGRGLDISVEHYIVSSGNAEIIEGTTIAKNFKAIYASRFMFDHNDVAVWPAQAINFTTKTQFLFRINKGAHDLSDESAVNQFVKMDERPVPFQNMIYIGDGDTDVPCFRLVKDQGGLSVAVFPPHTSGARKKAATFVNEGRVHSIALADYSEGKELEEIVKAQIEHVSAREKRDKTWRR